MGLTPLCPAGHLPLKGGDWLGACSSSYPQPSRWPKPLRDSISPPEGEMPGRAEGGKPHPLPRNTGQKNLTNLNRRLRIPAFRIGCGEDGVEVEEADHHLVAGEDAFGEARGGQTGGGGDWL